MTAADVSGEPADTKVPDPVRTGRAPLEQTPPELVPRLNEFTGYTKAHFQKVVLLPPFSADPLVDPQRIDAPLDLEDVFDGDSGLEEPVEGVVLVHEQTWRRKGLALGHLLHSLTLAPGEATRIAMQDWTRVVRGTADEVTLQLDTAAATETQTLALQEVTTGTAAEAQHGFAESVAAAESVQAGLAMFGISMAAAASHSIATTATSSSAFRSVGARENQDVHRATEQNAEAARTRRATVVREVTEAGQAQASTRVVANYNHAHALTVLYFEVVEVYSVETRVQRAKPCVFVPMALKDGAWLLRRYPTALAAAAQSAGMTGLAAAIRTLPTRLPLRPEPVPVGPLVEPVAAAVGTATSETDAVLAALNALPPIVSSLSSVVLALSVQPALAATIAPTVAPAVQAQREQVRAATDATARALAAATSARDSVAAIPATGLGPSARALLATATESLGQAAAAVTAVAAQLAALSRIGVHPTPRIDPPPPEPPPTLAELSQFTTLATEVVAAVRSQVQAQLGAARAKLTALVAALPPPPPERTDDDVAEQVAARIDEYREYFNQVVWSEVLTPRVVHLLLRDRMFRGEMLNDVLDPTPVAIIGNTVGFATTTGDFLSDDQYRPDIDTSDVVVSEMALPTGGVFAEAVLGQAVSAERIDLTRFWNWQDSPAPLLPTEITPVGLVQPAASIDLGTGRLDPTSAPLRDGQPLPAAGATGQTLAALRDGGAFRDMSGLDAAKEVAVKAMETAGSGSQDAARAATENFKNFAELVENVAPMLLTGGGSTLLGGLANNLDDEGGDD